MAQPFDEKRLRTVGEARTVSEQAGSFLNYGYFSTSANGVLVCRSTGGQISQLAWFDRQVNRLRACAKRFVHGLLLLFLQNVYGIDPNWTVWVCN
jgi:hypothetical protein